MANDYIYIKAWGDMLQSFEPYIRHEIEIAKKDNAPANAIYRNHTSNGNIWHTIDNAHIDTKNEIEKRVAELRKNHWSLYV